MYRGFIGFCFDVVSWFCELLVIFGTFWALLKDLLGICLIDFFGFLEQIQVDDLGFVVLFHGCELW